MDNKELERIQKELLALEKEPEQNLDDISLDELLAEAGLDELLAEETPAEEEIPEEILPADEDLSLEEILDDGELNKLLAEEAPEEEPTEKPVPAFDDPEQIHEPKEPLVYRNFATENDAQEKEAAELKRKKDERIVMGLMILACALCLSIIGILSYWLSFFK